MTPRRARMLMRRARALWALWAVLTFVGVVAGLAHHPAWVAAAVVPAWFMVLAMARWERYAGWLIGHDVALANARDRATTRHQRSPR